MKRIILFLVCFLPITPLAADPITDWGNYEVNVRDGIINEATAKAELPGIIDIIRQVCSKYNFTDNQLWIFPLKGYSLESIAAKGSDYQPDIVYGVSPIKGYNFFDGNRHGGHPAHDIFIKDRNQDRGDDITGQHVETVAMVDSLVLSTFTDWQPGSKLRGGNYLWLYNPKLEMFFYCAHLDKVSVKPGEFVKAGMVLGTVGRTGLLADKKSSPTHVHLMVLHYQNGILKPFEYYQELRRAIQ